MIATFGIGETPVGWQGTVSIWAGVTELNAFAYGAQQHREVIERTPRQRWYAEELYARFTVTNTAGDLGVIGWNGVRG